MIDMLDIVYRARLKTPERFGEWISHSLHVGKAGNISVRNSVGLLTLGDGQ
jgi:hypothetical protein